MTAMVPPEEEGAKRPRMFAEGAACAQLDLTIAHTLLRERGYDLLERFGHIHVVRDTQEWHVCLVADLASMPPDRLLACLDEAIALRVERRPALFL